jgi:hypothetical protein
MFIALAVVLVVCSVIGLNKSFSPEARRAAGFFGLAAIQFAIAGPANSVLASVLRVCAMVMMTFGAHHARTAWRNFDDRRMARRAEEYEARLNAQRATE